MFAIRQTPWLLGRLVAVMMLVLILGGGLLAVPRGAAGVEVLVTVSQHDFVAGCKAHGGTPERVTTHVVKCTNKDGSTITWAPLTGCSDWWGRGRDDPCTGGQ